MYVVAGIDMKAELKFKSVLLLQLCYLLQNVRSKHHCLTCRYSDEYSQSQENDSDLDEIPIVSIETPVPMSVSQLEPLSMGMSLPQILIPQMAVPVAAGSFPTPLLSSQGLVLFRIPSSYINFMKAILDTPTTTIITTTASTTTTQTTTTTSTEVPSVASPVTITTSESEVPNYEEPVLEDLPENELYVESDPNNVTLKSRKQDNALESVLQNIMNEFSDSLMPKLENNNKFDGRRRMTKSLRISKPTGSIPEFRILPIPDRLAKHLLSHLRSVKHVSSSRKKNNTKIEY